MTQFFHPVPPVITIGSTEHFIYLAVIIMMITLIICFRSYIKQHVKMVMMMVLVTAVFQRVLSNIYYVFIVSYPIEEALPLYICRLVCLLIILQCFIRNKWLDQLIFYWGLFAYGSFIYPVDISSPAHITGITFLILHGLIISFPLIRYYTTGFVPNIKGALLSAGMFLIYMPLVVWFSRRVDGNYFYTEQRPFLHEWSDAGYLLFNLIGVCTGFLIAGLIFTGVKRLAARTERI